MLLQQIPKNWETALDLSNGYKLEEFEVHMIKVDIAVIRILESVLVRVRNEKRRDVEKTYILEKT